MSKRVLGNFLMALALIPLGWALIHAVRGGSELPAPKWTEADLVPLPSVEDNAWYVMWPLETMPVLTLDIEARDDGSPILEKDRATLLETPVVSPNNQDRAEYVQLYGLMNSIVSDNIPFMIDLRDTVETLNGYFDPALAEELCASWLDRPRTPLYAYNGIGRQLATGLGTGVCASRGRVQKVTRALKEARAGLAEQLESQL